MCLDDLFTVEKLTDASYEDPSNPKFYRPEHAVNNRDVCGGQGNYWLAPNAKTNRRVTVDLMCPKIIRRIHLKNANNRKYRDR